MAQSLSVPLQDSIRFFHHPLPAIPLKNLAIPLPNGEDGGLTVFRIDNQMG
jgi:hypothetical protein